MQDRCRGCLWLDNQEQNYNSEPCLRCSEMNNEYVDEESFFEDWNNGHWDDSGD